jgi:hypothetical protein
MAALQEVIGELATDPSARAALEDDPQGFLVARDLDGFTAEDLRDALDLAADGLPVHVAAHLTGPDVPPAIAGEEDQEGVLRLLGHAAEAPEAPVETEDGDLDDQPDDEGADETADLDFGAGHAVDAGDQDGDSTPDIELDDRTEVEDGDEPDDAAHGADVFGELPGELIPDVEEEQPDLGEPDPLSEQSEEAPGSWGDHHTDDGSLDPQDFGDSLGDVPHA